MPARFEPPLGTTTVLPLFPASSSSAPGEQTLHFTYTPSNGFARGKTPEVWTNLPVPSSSASSTGAGAGAEHWRAVPFTPSPSAKGVFVASVPLDFQSGAEGSFEYTYRLRAWEGGDAVEWLGSEGSNGRVEVVRVSDAALQAAEAGPNGASGEGWTELDEGVRIWEAVVDGDKARFDLSQLVEGEQWSEAEAVVWEQSVRTWFQPRLLPRVAPLAGLSRTFPAQLLVLRSVPSRARPLAETLVLLPFSTREAASALYSNGNGGLELRAERDSPAVDGEQAKARLALAHSSGAPGSPSLGALLAAAGAAARATASGESYAAPSATVAAAELNEPKGLGLCTWNALSSTSEGEGAYTASGVLAWLDALLAPSRAGGALLPAAATTLLLDDGWQDVASFVDFSASDAAHGERLALRSFQCDTRGWYDLSPLSDAEEVEAERARRAQREKKRSLDSGYAGSPPQMRRRSLALEEGEELPREGVCVELRDVVGRIKEKGIERVGVWLTLAGYWHGVHPDSSLADAYTLRRVELRSVVHPSYTGHVFLPTVDDLPQFYRDYFASLAAAGVDFVKVDDQALVDAIVAQEVGEDEEPGAEPDDPGALRTAMLSSMRAAAVEIFGADAGALTHCMAGSPRIWAGALLGTGDAVRTSDDFFPAERDAHRWHVASNAFSALIATQALGLESDFDMAQAAPACEFAGAHLPLRAFSTAQVLATDPTPAGAGPAGWDALLAPTKRGIRVLQARAPGIAGTVLAASVGEDVLGRLATGEEAPPLKVGLPVPAAKGAHIGLWDCAPLPQEEGAGSERETCAVVDEKDVADVLAPLALLDEQGEVVLFTPQDPPAAIELTLKDVQRAGDAPRSCAKPLLSVQVKPTRAEVVTLAQLFPLTAAGAGGVIKVACLGLMGKTVGLAAIRSVGVGRAPAPQISEGAGAGVVGRAQSLLGAIVESVSGSSSSSSSHASSLRSSPTPSGRATPVPGQQSQRAAFPTPQGRLPFLLAYFASAFHRSATSAPSASARTPRGELRALAADLLSSPLRTLFAEVRALVSFGLAAVLWAVQGRGPGAQQGRRVEAAQAERVAMEDVGEPLRLELDYVGSLGLYVSLTSASSSAPVDASTLPLRITLDAAPLDAAFLRVSPLSSGTKDGAHLVELDLEGAWNKRIGSRPAHEAEGASAPEEGGEVRPWVVEVQALGPVAAAAA
ncbi:hypothetical protein JCM10450v2_001551 [Rhodotorula kratochvilovae]